MCGGRGTRMASDREKPLVRVEGRPLVDRVCDALGDARRVETVHAAVSPQAPNTREYVGGRSNLRVVETPGEGYVTDLTAALDAVGKPAVTVAADLPLLAGPVVDRLVRVARDPPVGESGGVESKGVGPAGVGSQGGESAESQTPVSTTAVVPARLKRALGVSADEQPYDEAGLWLPSGLNVVAAREDRPHRTWDARLAVNVNYAADVQVAERLLADTPNEGSREQADEGGDG